jgi:hypothetical protein
MQFTARSESVPPEFCLRNCDICVLLDPTPLLAVGSRQAVARSQLPAFTSECC